jgi:hypothetical protein
VLGPGPASGTASFSTPSGFIFTDQLLGRPVIAGTDAADKIRERIRAGHAHVFLAAACGKFSGKKFHFFVRFAPWAAIESMKHQNEKKLTAAE